MSKPRPGDVKAAIVAQTRRRSVRELAASGKSHVKVLSTNDVVQLVNAIVEQALADGGVKLTQDSRNKLASKAKKRFDKFAKEQSSANEKIVRQAETIGEFQASIDILVESEANLRREFDEAGADRRREFDEAAADLRRELDEAAARESELREQIQAGAQHEIELRRQHSRLREQLEQASSAEPELRKQFGLMEARVSELSGRLGLADARESKLTGKLDLAAEREAEARRQLDAAHSREERLGEIQVMLKEIGAARSGAGEIDTESLKASFSESLHEALDQIDRAVKRGSSSVVEAVPIDATSPMLARFFDNAGEDMESNAEQLHLEDSETEGIAGSLDRLRAMRRNALRDDDDDATDDDS